MEYFKQMGGRSYVVAGGGRGGSSFDPTHDMMAVAVPTALLDDTPHHHVNNAIAVEDFRRKEARARYGIRDKG